MSSLTDPRCCVPHLPKGETILLQLEADKSRTFTPKTIKWEDITIPEFLVINHENPSSNPQQVLSDIEEGTDGKVLVRFNSLNISRSRPSFSRSSLIDHFHSTRSNITELV